MSADLAGAIGRGRSAAGRRTATLRRRAPTIRAYDPRGHAHTLDPATDPGRRLLSAAQELITRAEAGSP